MTNELRWRNLRSEKEFFSGFRRFFTHYPLVGRALKWTLIALLVATLLYFTGGFAAIPLLAPIVAKFGALSLLVFLPVIGGALVALWYGAVKPILSWCASKFFYFHYAIRKIEAPKAEAPDSTRGLMDVLGAFSLAAPSHIASSTLDDVKSLLPSSKKVVKEATCYNVEMHKKSSSSASILDENYSP